MSKDIVVELIQTAYKACAEMRAKISMVRYGPPGLILFDFQGEVWAAPEPMDVMPAIDAKGTNAEASRSWALKQVINNKAHKYESK